MNKAFRLNPIPLPMYYPLSAMAYRFVKDFHKAVEIARKGIEVQPNMLFSYLVLAASCVERDMIEEAKNAANEAIKIDPRFSVGYVCQFQNLTYLFSDPPRFVVRINAGN